MTAPTVHHQVTYITADESDHDQRLDNFIFKRWKGVPKSHVYRVLRKGEVRINRKRVKASTKIQIGDEIRLPPIKIDTFLKPKPSTSIQTRLQASIIYEDETLIVLNKPSGVAVHGGSGVDFGVIEALRALYPASHYLELVHRIDRDTSGVLMIAKRRSRLRGLHQLLRDKLIQKEYLCLCRGHWQVIDAAISHRLVKHHLVSGERIVRVDPEGMTALTHFTTLESYDLCSIMQALPVSGRTHQIRVHATACHHPIAGDEKYGDKAFNQEMQKHGLNRLFLHAHRLSYTDPETQKRIHFEAPIPEELQAVLERVRTLETGLLP